MLTRNQVWKQYIEVILFALFVLFLGIFFLIELRSEERHFLSSIHTGATGQGQLQVEISNERTSRKDQESSNVYLKEVGRGKIKVAINTQQVDSLGQPIPIYESLFQGDPIERWSKPPSVAKIPSSASKNIKSPSDSPSSFKSTASDYSNIRAKAGISVEQAINAKKFLQLKNMDSDSQLAQQERMYFEEKYNVSKYPEMPFCIVVPSYMNAADDRYISNMKSILQQEYANYHVIFIDDASEDKTGEKMLEWAKKEKVSEEKLKIIINNERTMAMPNIYRAAKQFCKPYEIFIIVDGDDELIGKQVFKHFNQIFSANDVWIAYTNFINGRGTIGYSRPYNSKTMDSNNYRKSAFVISHLRAFFTKLLTNIELKDLKDEDGNWYRAANDVAMYLPIMQMTHRKMIYVPEISYLYNSNTGFNNHKVKLKEQKGNQRKIKSKKAYEPLDELFTDEEKAELNRNMGNKIDIYDN